MGFWTLYFGIEGGGDVVAVTANPSAGWTASSLSRVAVASEVSRVWVAKGKQ